MLRMHTGDYHGDTSVWYRMKACRMWFTASPSLGIQFHDIGWGRSSTIVACDFANEHFKFSIVAGVEAAVSQLCTRGDACSDRQCHAAAMCISSPVSCCIFCTRRAMRGLLRWPQRAIHTGIELFENSFFGLVFGLSRQCLIMRDMEILWGFIYEALPGQFP